MGGKSTHSFIDANEIADLCRKSKEPVYLTKNGAGDLVIMDIEHFTRREKMPDAAQ